MIVALAGIVLAPFHPEFVYDIRALIGRLSRELGWGERMGLHDCNPCMQPYINIMEYTLNDQKIVKGRGYVNLANPVLVGLENSQHKEP
jgi:hypothetical protein